MPRSPGRITADGPRDLAEALVASLRAPVDDDVAADSLTHPFHTYPAKLHPATARILVDVVADGARRGPLVDPFCGSGTVLIEAALIARNMAPGLFREKFGCERWPSAELRKATQLREQARAAVKPSKARLVGRDLDRAMLTGAQENLEAAGLGDAIELEHGNALEFAPRKGWGAWIVGNPPWGERIGEEREVARLYSQFGALLRERCAGFHASLLVRKGAIAEELRLPNPRRTRVLNGGIECEVVTADL